MSNKLKNNTEAHSCEGVVLDSGDGEFTVKGNIKTLAANPTVLFWAANPPTYSSSFTGSGMPFPNPDIAYDNTPNRGAVKATGNSFEFKIRYPNSYYLGLGSQYVEPCVHIKVCGKSGSGKIHTIKLGKGIPFRSTTNTPSNLNINSRTSAMFYSGRGKLPIRTQEQILRDSGFPEENITPNNFWGGTPPHE
jgi:hypothetical protein